MKSDLQRVNSIPRPGRVVTGETDQTRPLPASLPTILAVSPGHSTSRLGRPFSMEKLNFTDILFLPAELNYNFLWTKKTLCFITIQPSLFAGLLKIYTGVSNPSEKTVSFLFSIWEIIHKHTDCTTIAEIFSFCPTAQEIYVDAEWNISSEATTYQGCSQGFIITPGQARCRESQTFQNYLSGQQSTINYLILRDLIFLPKTLVINIL